MSVRDPRTLEEMCQEVEKCIDRSGVAPKLEALLSDAGRPRELSVRTFLVGMMLAIQAGLAPHIAKARWVLGELPDSDKARLGVTRDSGEELTYKQMADMFERIATPIDASPHFRGEGISEEERALREKLLVEVTELLLAASIPEGVPHHGSYSIDGTNVDSWASPKVRLKNNDYGSMAVSHLPEGDPVRKAWISEQKKRRASRNQAWPTPRSQRPAGIGPSGRKTRVSTTRRHQPNYRRQRYGVADPDSSRYERPGWRRDGKSGFGLEMHSFVMVAEEGRPPIPPFARHLRLTPNQSGLRGVVVDMAMRISKSGDPVSDAIYDAGYGQFVKINAGMRQAGFNPVFDLWTGHHGVTGAIAGAIVVDGGLYSPGLPEGLRDLKPPAVGTGMKQLNHYQELIEERQRYALRRLGAKPSLQGMIRYQCPASAGKVGCPLKPASLSISTSKGLIVPSLVPPPGAQGDICKQATVTIDLDDPNAFDRSTGYVGGLYQKHPFGSDAHYDSMKRRAYAEAAFGNIKNEAEQSLRRPSIRVMGRAKMTLVSALVVAAANLRMGRLWTKRQHQAHTISGQVSPVMSSATVAAAKAQKRALGRRKRKQSQRDQDRISKSPSGRPRGRPPD